MSTVKMQLSTDIWTRVTDGTETKSLQVVKGNALLSLSATTSAPDANAAYHNIFQGMFFTITPPSIVWVKGIGISEIVVS